jgi:hypothetical protein
MQGNAFILPNREVKCCQIKNKKKMQGHALMI